MAASVLILLIVGWSSSIRRGVPPRWRFFFKFSSFPTLEWTNSDRVWNDHRSKLFQTLEGFLRRSYFRTFGNLRNYSFVKTRSKDRSNGSRNALVESPSCLFVAQLGIGRLGSIPFSYIFASSSSSPPSPQAPTTPPPPPEDIAIAIAIAIAEALIQLLLFCQGCYLSLFCSSFATYYSRHISSIVSPTNDRDVRPWPLGGQPIPQSEPQLQPQLL